MLILERGVTHTDYFAQQAAIQSFITAGLLVGVVAQQVGPERAQEIQKQASAAVAGLFGEATGRSGNCRDVGGSSPLIGS